MKKTLACLLVILMLLLAFPVSAQSGFQDVPADAWYAQAISYVSGSGLMHGVGSGTFAPGGNVTRGMFVTVLSRLSGIDLTLYEGDSFEDVPAGAYDSPSIQWAASHGIVNGKTADHFAPKENLRREDAAVILFRYAQKSGNNTDYSDVALNIFSDESKVSAYALPACKWAADKGILKGSGGRLDPQGNMTRAQLAQLMFNIKDFLTERDYTADYYLTALPKSKGKLSVNLINHLILFYNDDTLRAEIDKNISIEPFLNNDDLQVSEAARFAQVLLSGGAYHSYISQLYDGSRVFALFNDYYDYGSGNILYRIEDNQMEEFFVLPEPLSYIKEQTLSADQRRLLVLACSRKSDTLLLVDAQNSDNATDLIAVLKKAIADDGLYENHIREDGETYAVVSDYKWENDFLVSFKAEIPYDNMSTVLAVSAKFDLTSKSITYEILPTPAR